MHESKANSESESKWTVQSVAAPRASSLIEAEFIRLPRPKTRCPISQLSRTTLCELIEAGKIKSIKLRKKGAVRGIVLINRESLVDYLHGLEE
jgi:hypothetical protein